MKFFMSLRVEPYPWQSGDVPVPKSAGESPLCRSHPSRVLLLDQTGLGQPQSTARSTGSRVRRGCSILVFVKEGFGVLDEVVKVVLNDTPDDPVVNGVIAMDEDIPK